MLSRYNQATAQWRNEGLPDDPNRDSLSAIMCAQAVPNELFPERMIVFNPAPATQYKLPNPEYVGLPTWCHTSQIVAKLSPQ
jgi:hypothetical protein